MNKVTMHLSISILVFILIGSSAFASGRGEEPVDKGEVRVFWILDGSMSAESAEMFLERYLFPTSLATMLWTDFTLQGGQVRFDTEGGYRIVRKQRVLAEAIDGYTVYGYNLTLDVAWSAEGRSQAAPGSRTVALAR